MPQYPPWRVKVVSWNDPQRYPARIHSTTRRCYRTISKTISTNFLLLCLSIVVWGDSTSPGLDAMLFVRLASGRDSGFCAPLAVGQGQGAGTGEAKLHRRTCCWLSARRGICSGTHSFSMGSSYLLMHDRTLCFCAIPPVPCIHGMDSRPRNRVCPAREAKTIHRRIEYEICQHGSPLGRCH